MSISFASLLGGNPWYSYGSADHTGNTSLGGGSAAKAGKTLGLGTAMPGVSPYLSLSDDQTNNSSLDQRKEIRDQLRQLKQEKYQEKTNPFGVTKEDMVSSLLGETETDDKDEVKENTSVNYNFRSVTSKIQQAKTSASAGRAVLSAKRKIQELKRKLANSDADPDEVTFALNHAKRIERVAKKKQRHLEMEEMITRTQKRDEVRDKTEQAAEDLAMSQRDLLEEKLTDKQNEFDEKQTAMFVEAIEKLKEKQSEISDDMIAAVDEMIESITEKEQEMLSEIAEMLENMEILDPHMSEEDLKKLKIKHRNAEYKEIVKANADYWKSMMEHNTEKMASHSMGGSTGGFCMSAMNIDVSVAGAVPSAADLAMSSFDAQA